MTEHPTIFFPPSMARFSPLRAPAGRFTEHPGVAYDLAAALRPRLVVAIGVRRGAAYFASCQSLREHGIEALCYAVGTWESDGDEVPGRERASGTAPDDESFDDFANHGRALYGDFSYVLRCTAGEAAPQFDEASVELLLLDEECPEPLGETLRTWLPRLRPGGVLLLHDAGEAGSHRRAEWEEISAGSSTFNFEGSPALALLRVPGPYPPHDDSLRFLFEGDPESRAAIRATYSRGARFLELDRSVGFADFGHARRNRPGRAPGAP